MSTNPELTEMLCAAGEALQLAVARIAPPIGLENRDAIAGATLAAGLRALADELDAGPAVELLSSVLAELIRDRATALDGVL